MLDAEHAMDQRPSVEQEVLPPIPIPGVPPLFKMGPQQIICAQAPIQ